MALTGNVNLLTPDDASFASAFNLSEERGDFLGETIDNAMADFVADKIANSVEFNSYEVFNAGLSAVLDIELTETETLAAMYLLGSLSVILKMKLDRLQGFQDSVSDLLEEAENEEGRV